MSYKLTLKPRKCVHDRAKIAAILRFGTVIIIEYRWVLYTYQKDVYAERASKEKHGLSNLLENHIRPVNNVRKSVDVATLGLVAYALCNDECISEDCSSKSAQRLRLCINFSSTGGCDKTRIVEKRLEGSLFDETHDIEGKACISRLVNWIISDCVGLHEDTPVLEDSVSLSCPSSIEAL